MDAASVICRWDGKNIQFTIVVKVSRSGLVSCRNKVPKLITGGILIETTFDKLLTYLVQGKQS